jgi:DnaJ-class molecular chaperone
MDDSKAAAGSSGKPGDQAPPGTAGTGEALCPVCGGSGRVDGTTCENCRGTGKIVEGIGGA